MSVVSLVASIKKPLRQADRERPTGLQSDTTGDIVTCSGAFLRVWSVNGELLAKHATSNFVDPITAVAFSLVSSKLEHHCAEADCPVK